MTTSIKTALLGAAGRMGHILTEMLNQSADFDLVARIDAREDALLPAIIHDIGDAPEFDILIDFSQPAATTAALAEVKRRKCAWLVATTGLAADLKSQILALSNEQPIFIASNTSLGIAVMQRLCREAAAALDGWDCEICETHHHFKVDAPSGTALTLANAIADVQRQNGHHPQIITDRSALREARNPDSIGISSLRGGTVTGEHTACWFGDQERLEIKHTAENRAIFAHGALKIAKWLAMQKPGAYSMDNLLDDILT